MCFIVDNRKEYKKAKIAGRNIVCYKESIEISMRSINKELFTPFYQYTFTYHVNIPTRKVRICKTKGEFFVAISKGYHSYKLKKYATPLIGKFVIPKGTKYYENKTEYVSETLIFKGYIK